MPMNTKCVSCNVETNFQQLCQDCQNWCREKWHIMNSSNFISAYFDPAPKDLGLKHGDFFHLNCGGSSIWVLSRAPPTADEAMWSARYEGKRYIFVFYPYEDDDIKNTSFYDAFPHKDQLEKINGGVYIYQTNDMLENFDIETEIWGGLESDELDGDLTYIDTMKQIK